MSDIAKLVINDQEYEFPVRVGTENEIAIDIKTLRAATNGVITIDSGFKNTGSCESKITFLDGEKGILRHRGYAIEELTKKASFLEVAYLVIFGELPTKKQFAKWEADIKRHSLLNEEMKNIIDGFPKKAHPMGVLSSLTSALTAFNPATVDINSEEQVYGAITTLMGKFPVIAAWAHRKPFTFCFNIFKFFNIQLNKFILTHLTLVHIYFNNFRFADSL